MSAAALTKKSSTRVSTGTLTKYTFPSASLGGLETSFNIFIPDSASPSAPVPVLYYLAGLTCTEDTGPQKGGLLNTAGKHALAMVFPDTSPRGAGIEGEEDDWDFGTSAGFYLTATSDKWGKYYNMYDLVVSELPAVLAKADLGLVRSLCVHDEEGLCLQPEPRQCIHHGPLDGRPRRPLALP